MQKNINNIRLWGVLLFIVLAVIIFLPAVMEYHSTKSDLVRLWQDQSRLVAETIVRGSQTMMRFDEQFLLDQKERLINDGLALRQLDSLNFPELRPVFEFARRRLHASVLFFSEQGQLLNPPPSGSMGDRMVRRFHDLFLQAIKTLPRDSLIYLAPPEAQMRHRPPFLIIRRANQRGYMAVLIRPAMGERMMRFRGMKRWLNEIVKSPGILYIQLLKEQRPLLEAGDFLLAPLEPPAEASSSKISWQILKSAEQTIFDYWQPAPNQMIIRIGLATTALAHLQQNLVRRLIFNSLLLLILGFLVMRFILSRQNVALLQSRLSQLETYTVSILKNMSDGILAFNSRFEIEFTNAAYSRLTGAQDVDRFNSAIQFLPSELQQKIKDFQEIENFSFQHDNHFLLISGKKVNAGSEENHSDLLYLLIVRDFTSQKELDEIRTRRNKLLAMGELASRVAHEIRNPLNGIAMLAQRLQKEFRPTENDEEFRQMTSAIRQETERLNQIVHSFLIYARSPRLKFQSTSLGEFLSGLKPVLQASGSSPLSIHIQSDVRLPIDRDQLKQALINLVKNAMEASPPQAPVSVRLEVTENKARILIEDEGGGIQPELKERIFDLYFTTREEGTGIGLSIVEKIVEAHGGKIKVESPYRREGKEIHGARFIIELPIKEAKGEAQ
ncbi:sensor histidine kinase [Calditrichota bacterium GD2]